MTIFNNALWLFDEISRIVGINGTGVGSRFGETSEFCPKMEI